MKNILVLGSRGMLGYGVRSYFVKHDYNVTGITRDDFDAANDPVLKIENQITNSDIVINCIGIIKPMIEKNTAIDVLKVNSIFPRNLANLCKKANVKLVHVTTDCVFSGKTGYYNEKDYYDADDLYGISKSGGDTCECMSLRTSFVGPELGRSRSLLEWAFSQKGKSVNGFTNHKWNGVSSIYFAEIIEKIVNLSLYKEGIFHIFSPNTVTKYELLKIFNEVFGLGMTITAVEAPVVINRDLSSIYDIAAMVSTKTIETQMLELKTFFKL